MHVFMWLGLVFGIGDCKVLPEAQMEVEVAGNDGDTGTEQPGLAASTNLKKVTVYFYNVTFSLVIHRQFCR